MTWRNPRAEKAALATATARHDIPEAFPWAVRAPAYLNYFEVLELALITTLQQILRSSWAARAKGLREPLFTFS